EYLEEDPNVDAGEHTIERKHLEIVEAQSDDLVENGGAEEEQRDVAGELEPTFLGVMEGLAEHETEEDVPRMQPAPEHSCDQSVEKRDLDLNPHGIAGDQGQSAEHDADAAREERHDRRPAQHPQAYGQGYDGGGNQRPCAGGDAMDAVDEEHRPQRTDLAEECGR